MRKASIQMETNPPWNVFDSRCPTRQVLDLIADKWSVLIIRSLSDGTMRFSQLRRAINGISQKALTATLRGLERDGIVKRRIYASVPPRVEYSLTDLGRSLIKLVAGICTWAEAHIEEVQTAREIFHRADGSSANTDDIATQEVARKRIAKKKKPERS